MASRGRRGFSRNIRDRHESQEGTDRYGKQYPRHKNKQSIQNTQTTIIDSSKGAKFKERFTSRGAWNSGRGNDGRRKNFIGYKKLEIWANETNAVSVLLQIENESETLTELLETSIKPDWYILLVKICGLILTADHQKQMLVKALNIFVTSDFFGQNLFNFVQEKKNSGWDGIKEFCDQIMFIMKRILLLLPLPSCALKCRMALSFLENLIQENQEYLGQQIKSELLHSIGDFQEKIKNEECKSDESKMFRKKIQPKNDAEAPPEDFRTLSVIPDANDLISDSFVRANIARGAYKNEDHYLDVQFRLIREDFMRPLREGINEFKEKGCKNDYRSSDIRLYFDVHIVGMTKINGINHVLQFDVTSLKFIKWEHSKRFLNGSLLCLSKDNFDTVLFATVAFRNPENLRKGIINVEFRNGLETVFRSTSSETFIMAETTTYFEAYCPILEALKEANFSNSLKRYLIYGEKNLLPPKYLLGAVQRYDLSCLTIDGRSCPVPVLNTKSWPPAEQMVMNESQREAVKLALTKELAIIQGPPGTGKTFVGLKVMRILLENQTHQALLENQENMLFSQTQIPHKPILVVCYTNHALDQFLEGVAKFCPTGIVRVGGKSSSSLEKMNLRNIKKNEQLERRVKNVLWRRNLDLKIISDEIASFKSKIDSSCFKVMDESVLQDYMSCEHYDSLMNEYEHSEGITNDDFKSKTSLWLKTCQMIDKGKLPDLIKCKLTKLVLEMPARLYKGIRSKNLESRNSILSFPVVERACMYRGWLDQVRSQLDLSVYDHQHIFEESKSKILSDSYISAFIPPEIFDDINQKTTHGGNDAVENWVLGLRNKLSDQLDEIENLMYFLSKSEVNNDDFDDVDGAEDAQSARHFDVDMKDEEEVVRATQEIRERDENIMMKAEKLGLTTDKENNEGDREESSWQTVRHKKPIKFSKCKEYLENIQPMTEEEERTINNLWSLDMNKRFSLYKLWTQRYCHDLSKRINYKLHEYEIAMSGKREIKMEIDIDILKQAKVIGMTTTGAAKYRKLLQAVSCQIIVVEEAAEVLEAHIITALNENCKHLILIGDHQQLKPNPTVYALAKDYHLDLSLFERLINNNIHHVKLEEQHRMRQSISKIMRHIYPNLQDHVSVTKYENVYGMEKNLFFINHQEYESHVEDLRSKSNSYEASYLVALLRYLLSQGYESSQVTILTTYVGQVLILKKELRERQIHVCVTTVDKFQGEENDIILLSLVRSNAQSNVGFLKIDNRVCVALSRAKKGLYAIGNFKMLSSQSKLWEKILKTAEDDGILGNALPIICVNHPSFKAEINCPKEFQEKFPEGGCGRPCEFRLNCGHSCPLQCHGYDSKHEKIKCTKKCAMKCSQGHPCKKQCHEVCGMCTEKVEKVIPRCGHSNKIPCDEPAQTAICSTPCRVMLECGHSCTGKCGECHKNKVHAKCRIPVEYFWPCDHILKVPCYMKPSEYHCPEKCKAILECGHICTGTCSECLEGALHIGCKKVCPKILPCGHQCSSPCGIPCPPCSKTCSNSCRHSRCNVRGHICGDRCVPCEEPCLIQCNHLKCGNKCHEECDIEPCQERCHKNVTKCKHPCSGLCGELCVCALCDSVCSIPQKDSDYQMLKKKNMVSERNGDSQKIGNTPEYESKSSQRSQSSILIKIDCNHTFCVNELSLYIENVLADDNTFYIPCPVCAVPIRNCFQYNKSIKRIELKREQEKEKIRQKSFLTAVSKIKGPMGQQIVRKKDLHGTCHSIVKANVDDFSTSYEVFSLNVKCKWAYILCDLEILSKKTCSEAYPLTRIHKAVKKLGSKITRCQISDLQFELKYLLLQICMDEVEKLWYGVNLTDLKKILEETKKIHVLENTKLESTVFTQVWHSVQTLNETSKKFFTPDAEARFTVIMKKVEAGMAILDSETEEMLCDLVLS